MRGGYVSLSGPCCQGHIGSKLFLPFFLPAGMSSEFGVSFFSSCVIKWEWFFSKAHAILIISMAGMAVFDGLSANLELGMGPINCFRFQFIRGEESRFPGVLKLFEVSKEKIFIAVLCMGAKYTF